MDPLPGAYYWKGLILVRAPERRPARAELEPKEKPEPLRAPVEPLPHPEPLALPSLRLVSIA